MQNGKKNCRYGNRAPTWLSSIERWLVEPIWRTPIGQFVKNMSVQFSSVQFICDALYTPSV